MTRVRDMNDENDTAPSPIWRIVKIAGLGLGTLFCIGMVAGFSAAAFGAGEAIGAMDIAILTGLVLIAIGAGWLLVRNLRPARAEEPLTPREKRNRNILTVSGLLGGAMGVLIMLAQGVEPGAPMQLFSSDPLPATVAIILVVLTAVVLPVISYFWHRTAIDEQEADAYKTGALWGLYLFMIGAPVWWFAWRGGFAPAPDGVAIYFATITVVGAVWTWKKYR